MILLESTQILGWEPAIRGMRNPMNSWDKSDSHACWRVSKSSNPEEICKKCQYRETDKYDLPFCSNPDGRHIIGPNDLDLMLRLAKAGSVDGKFRRMIAVYVDITAPLYWWKEFDTYKVGTVANSCSTMHRIHAKEFTLEDFSHEHLGEAGMTLLRKSIKLMNAYRNCFIDYDKPHDPPHKLPKKTYWWQMIQLLPSSYNQKRTVMLNYEVLANIYQHRRNHKLDEWREVCHWIESLPYSEIITCDLSHD